MDLYASSDDKIHAYAAWHYTMGWGNLFTVTVAVIAITASVTVSAITLRRNASHFEQGRIDTRKDKLRAEVIDLISALSQRRSQVAIVFQRIRQLESVDRQAIHQNIEAMFSEDLWDSYRRATSHAFAVLALTEDKEATEAVGLILAAIEKIRKLVENGAANPSTIHLVERAELDTISHAIDAAVKQLKSYAVCKLGVAAYDEHGRPLNKLDVLSPIEGFDMDDVAVKEFSAALAHHDAVVTDADTLTAKGHDYWGFGGTPGLLVRPNTREEVIAVLRIAAQQRIHVVTRGGGSNCAGAMMPSPDRVMIDLSTMDRVLDIDPTARTARIQPGVINADLQQQLAPHRLCFSPDPVSARLATVGGNIIENAGGPHALKYGVTYNHVLAVEAVLADGTVIHLSAEDDGPDLLGVLIGSEGTLGIVTEATVAVRPIPPVTRSLMGSFTTARDAAETVSAITATGTVPAALEWLDRLGIAGLQQLVDTGYPTDVDAILLIDIDGTPEQVDHDTDIVEQVLRRTAVEVRRADDEDARAKLWYGRLHAPDAVVAVGKGFFIGDVTVPRNRIPDMQEAIQAAAARHADALLFIATAGHAGDGDLHPITFYDRDNPKAAAALESANSEIIDAALALGGTITGEHGVGTEKRQFMTKRFTPVEIAAQRAIKRVFDPTGLLNPGIMLPDESPDEPRVSSFEAALRTALQGHPTTAATTSGGTQIAVNTANLSLVVGAAVTLDELSRHLSEHGVSCAAIPSESTERTVGELIADPNAAERQDVRHALLGLEVVLPDGHAQARFGGETVKDVAGYDTKRLFIGGRGAFGAITSAIFKITVDAA